MTVYWLMLMIPMMIGLSSWRIKGALVRLQWIMYGFCLFILVGLRHQVGGDWGNYIQNYTWIYDIPFRNVLMLGFSHDLGYEVLYWISLHYLNGIYATNLICGLIFIAGLLRLCRKMPMPWLALSTAIPYLVIVVAMGYTRQAVAIGFLMWGLVELMEGKVLSFYLSVLFGVLFHKTMLMMLPVGFFYANPIINFRRAFLYGFLLLLGGYLSYSSTWLQGKIYHYIVSPAAESSGAFVRVLMNVFAALVFMYFQKRWTGAFGDEGLWGIFSVLSLVMLPLALASSTTVDRLALYFIPLQMVAFSRAPVLMKNVFHRTLFVLVILLYYIGVLFIWLNFGSYSAYWMPYQNILF